MMDDRDEGDGGQNVDKGWKTEGWSDEGCLWNKETEWMLRHHRV